MRRSILAVVLVAIIATVSVTVFAQAKKAEKPEKVKDVVCGMMVDKNPELSARHNGETFYFCSRADMEKFKQEPQKYVRK
jgi:YHS domain-containing protein